MADWTLICNNGRFDLIEYFKHNQEIVWRQNKYVELGDYAFFYLSSPFSCIKFCCRVIEVDIRDKKKVLPLYLENYPESDNTQKETVFKYMKLELVTGYDNDVFHREKLLEHGMRSFQKSCQAPDTLSKYLHQVIDGEV